MPSRRQLPEASLTYDARTTLSRMYITDDNMATAHMNQSTNNSATGTNSPQHSANNESPTRSPSSSDTVTANFQPSSSTLTFPTPKISIREYTLWKVSGISPYSAYLAWKEDNMEVDLEAMVKLKDMPHIRQREEKAEKNVEAFLEREKRLEGRIRDRDGLWGTQFV